MKVLMITDFYWPFLGGVEQHVRSLSAELTERGHEIHVATLWHEGLAPREADGDVHVHRLRGVLQKATWLYQNRNRPWAPPLPDPAITRALWTLIRREQPAIVHGHDWLARSFLPLKRFTQSKLVMSLHYYTLSCPKKSLMYQGQPCLGPQLGKCLACAGDHYGAGKGTVVTLGNWMMAQAEKAAVDMFLPVSQATADGNQLPASGLPYRVVPNFISGRLRRQATDVSTYVQQLPREPFFLFVGDLRRDKGIEVLLDAYRQLPAGTPPLVLIGKLWAETPQRFPSNVHVFQNWPNAAVLAAYRQALAGIVPSIWAEPFGIVVIEAMTQGCPVIASNLGGLSDLVHHERTGLVVPPGNASLLAQAMLRLAQDEKLRKQLGTNAELEARLYQADAVVPDIERIYLDLLQGSAHATSATAGKYCHQ